MLAELQSKEENLDLSHVKEVQGELHDLLKREETKWKQRSKELWLKEGDRNSKYFHECANSRRCCSTISKITDAQGRLCEKQEEIIGAFTNYFQSLFQT